MRHRVTRWIWQLPAAIHYAFSLLLSASMVLARWNLTTYLGDRAPFTFAFMSVLIASFVGGFGPGLLAALIWLLLGLPLFLPPILSFDIIDPRHGWLLASNALLWVLTAAMCHQLRQAVIRGDEVASRLQLQGEKLSAVIDSITDGFFAAASDWTITRSNQRFHDHFDVKPPPSGQNLWTSTGIGDIAIVRQALETAMSKRIFQSVELNIEIDHRWLQIRCHPTGDKGIFCILQDITERKRLEEHQEKMLAYERAARSSAEQASHLKDEFLATLSHELRTPLTSLFGWLELIESRSELDPQAAEGIDAVRRSANSLNQLIEELLDVSRINAGKVQLELRTLDLCQAVSDAIEVIRPAGIAKSIEITFSNCNEDAYILGDKDRIHQIFANVLSNAVRFTPKGGIVKVNLDSGEAGWSVSIQDTGQGIDPQELRTIFERFRQSDAGSNRRHGGLGLGLAIARQLVELHGGEITAQSAGLGEGSTFTVTFPPAAAPARTYSKSGAPALNSSRVGLIGLKIVLVEDDESTREVLARLLRSEGAEVTGLVSGLQALEELTEECPDLLISDIGMPEMDGYQMISRIRAIGGPCQTIPAIALTAFARSEDISESIAQGFNAHLSKPVAFSDLIALIHNLIPEDSAMSEESHCPS